MKKAGEDVAPVLAEMKRVSDEITGLDAELKDVEAQLENILLYIPNIPHESTPVGRTAEDNVEVRRWIPEGDSLESAENKPLDHIALRKEAEHT
jgi:seryl-tRNA synthetase